jgi:MFS family permease
MQPQRPARILPAIVFSQFAGTSLWFAGNAVLPDLQREFGLDSGAVATITSAVQLGFIAGTLAFAALTLADRFSPRKLFLACAILGAIANAAVFLIAATAWPYAALVALRFATGFFLAGIYPVGMKIAAGWYREGLGAALGSLVGALVLGTAFPHLVRAWGGEMPWRTVMGAVSILALAGGAAMYALVPDGPHLAKRSRFDPRAFVTIFSVPALRASAFGYFGHMWELYTMWALVPLMIGVYDRSHGGTIDVSLWSFLVIGAGSIGCVAGGLASHRAGSARVAQLQLRASGLCCLLSPLAYLAPPVVFLAFLVFWGVVVVGDSPQFSALTASVAPRELVGSALTLVNCIGFSLTIASLQLATALARWLPPEWWFVPIAIGPALGLMAIRPLARPPRGDPGGRET